MIKKIQRMIVLLSALALVAAFVVMVGFPSQNVSANTKHQQGPEDCRKCHEQPVGLWDGSPHNTGKVTCIVCHKLASGGSHPGNAKFTVENEEITCQVCHKDVTGTDVTGQESLSKHGRVGLTCISCHEQHSQGLKLSAGSRIVCENCHKKEMAVMTNSTHYKAGLSCINCHMGKHGNHTMQVSLETCSECHDNPHEANVMLSAGLNVRVMSTPAGFTNATPQPAQESASTPTPAPAAGGVNMPPWTLVFAGMLIGGIISWALAGRDPGKPSIEESEQPASKEIPTSPKKK